VTWSTEAVPHSCHWVNIPYSAAESQSNHAELRRQKKTFLKYLGNPVNSALSITPQKTQAPAVNEAAEWESSPNVETICEDAATDKF